MAGEVLVFLKNGIGLGAPAKSVVLTENYEVTQDKNGENWINFPDNFKPTMTVRLSEVAGIVLKEVSQIALPQGPNLRMRD